MANYSDLDQNQIQQLLQPFALGQLQKYTIIPGGAANSSFIIQTDRGQYILSVCDEKKFTEVKTIVDVLLLLEQYQFPAPRILSDREGQYIHNYREKPVIVKKYLPGEVLTTLSETILEQLGTQLAKLHQIPPLEKLLTFFPFGLDYFQEIQLISHPDNKWFLEKANYLTANINGALPRSMIHGDIFCDNIVITEKKQVAILDFEEVCHYYRVFDIGMCMIGTCQTNKNTLCLRKASALLKGYLSVQVLTDQEQKQLQLFAEYAAIAIGFWRFRQYHLRQPNIKKQQAHQQMITMANFIHNTNNQEFAQIYNNL